MKMIFDEGTRKELRVRIQNIPEDARTLWGKMNLYQTPMHCFIREQGVRGSEIPLVKSDENCSNPRFIHNFLGKMTPERIRILTHKHTYYHLRFNS